MKKYQFPIFALDPAKVWSEVPTSPQSTVDVTRAVSALTIVLAYMMSGNRFRGSYEDYTLEELDKELHEFCTWHMLSPDRVVGWAESLLLPVTYQAPLGSMVETRMPILGFGLHGYQRDTAEWMASRQGGVLALSCGTGKSVTAWAAAKAALRNKQCSGERCTIICPLNAVDQWTAYVEDLKKDFNQVEVLSVDSTHKYTNMSKVGGALIIDECFPGHVAVATEEGPLTFHALAKRTNLPRVLTRDAQGKEYYQTPTRLVRNPNTRGLVRVWYGENHVDCTPDHPIWTEEAGYIEVGLLRVGEHHLRVLSSPSEEVAPEGTPTGSEVLQQELRGEVPHAGTRSSGQDAQPQPNAESCCPEQDDRCAQGASVSNPPGWERDTSGAAAAAGQDTPRSEGGVCHRDEGAPRPVPGQALRQGVQARSDLPTAEAGGGAGRVVARSSAHQGPGCKEDGGSCVVRVDRVEVLEPAGGQRSAFGDEVYCLEVEGTHCFFAGGALVHNCHYVKSPDSARTANTFDIRLGYDWCACLTGTLLHTGPEGVLAIQDAAIPGLSRFTDKWKFGDAFDCVVRKKVGSRTKSVLAIPTAEHFEPFVAYLARGVRSLSFESPEVRASGVLPGQTKHTMDTWPTPAWVKELHDTEAAANAARLGLKVTSPEVIALSRFFWLPDCNWRWALGATAVAIMHEIAELKALGLDPDREPLPERLKLPVDEEDEAGLPTFAKVRMEATREGRLDRCIELVGDTFKWRYAPGTDVAHPGPGVKIQAVMQWVDKHPGEPALIASVSSLAKVLVIAELTKRGLKFGVIDGTVDVEDRGKIVAKFQAEEIDYVVVQQVAGSTSITLTRAANSFLIDHSWSPIHYTQLLARTCRTGQKRECDHYDLVFGALQMEVVRTLQRGEAFDVRARARLEEMMREAMTTVRTSPSPSMG